MGGRRGGVGVCIGDDRRCLEAQVRRHKGPRALSDRVRMVLHWAEGLQSKEVAERLGVHEHTVGKWRSRFVQAGIEGRTDEYRAGRPRRVSDTQVAQEIERTTNTTTYGPKHWWIRYWEANYGHSDTPIRRTRGASGVTRRRY